MNFAHSPIRGLVRGWAYFPADVPAVRPGVAEGISSTFLDEIHVSAFEENDRFRLRHLEQSVAL